MTKKMMAVAMMAVAMMAGCGGGENTGTELDAIGACEFTESDLVVDGMGNSLMVGFGHNVTATFNVHVAGLIKLGSMTLSIDHQGLDSTHSLTVDVFGTVELDGINRGVIPGFSAGASYKLWFLYSITVTDLCVEF